MELPRTIDMQHEAVMTDLSSREPLFHRPEHGTSCADFERMTIEEFWEIGASGRRYTREFVLDELEKRFGAGPARIGRLSSIKGRLCRNRIESHIAHRSEAS